MTVAQRQEIRRYLSTGESDPLPAAWGGGAFEAAHQASQDLKSALIEEVKQRSSGRRSRSPPRGQDLRTFARAKVEPMVRGLFPARERDPVLAMLERSVVFLTQNNVERVLRQQSWLSTAWTLANLYLTSLGAEPLGEGFSPIVGLSEETNCYVSTEYFTTEDTFADFVVHEAAHVFHNCKRATIGLPQNRRREWLLDIDFGMRETFAYGCETFGRVCELGPRPADRRTSRAPGRSEAGDRSGRWGGLSRHALRGRRGSERVEAHSRKVCSFRPRAAHHPKLSIAKRFMVAVGNVEMRRRDRQRTSR